MLSSQALAETMSRVLWGCGGWTSLAKPIVVAIASKVLTDCRGLGRSGRDEHDERFKGEVEVRAGRAPRGAGVIEPRTYLLRW